MLEIFRVFLPQISHKVIDNFRIKFKTSRNIYHFMMFFDKIEGKRKG